MCSGGVLEHVVSLCDVVEVPSEEGVDHGIEDDADWAPDALLVEDFEKGEGVSNGSKEEADSHPGDNVLGVLGVVLLKPLVPLHSNVEWQGEDDEEDEELDLLLLPLSLSFSLFSYLSTF